jgi:predicted enzyme related to lactoylglutathione lyase
MSHPLCYDGTLTCALETADLDAGIEWYTRVLGLTLLYRKDDIGWCELSTPIEGVNIGLSQVESPGTRGGATLTFGVDDLDAARQRLESDGVRFDGESIEIPGLVRLAGFFDPAGNKFMLAQTLMTSAAS